MVINTDGVSKGNPKQASCTGVARDTCGTYLVGFWNNISGCSSLEVELWGVIYALKLAWSRGWKHVMIQCDSKVIVSLLQGKAIGIYRVKNLLTNCKKI